MRTTTRRQLAAMVITVFVALAGCGSPGKDSGGGDGGANGSPAAGGSSAKEQPATFEVARICSLLEKTEIKAQFGEHGEVTDGEYHAELSSCYWQIGRQVLQLRAPARVANPRERLASQRDDLAKKAEYKIVDVDGLGDYAYAILWNGTTQLVFLSKGVVLYLYTFMSATDKLVALAGHAVKRI